MRHLLSTALLLLTAAAPVAPPPSISGELIDSYCYAHARIAGPAHAACALKCVRAGIPPALLDSATRKVYVLLPAKDASALPPELIAQMGHPVTVEGDLLPTNGTTFLIVRSFHAVR
jgi:hypothetical protein